MAWRIPKFCEAKWVDLPSHQILWGRILCNIYKINNNKWFQFSSVSQSCLTFCDPMDCSMPDLPVHHQFPGFTQTYVHHVSNAIQPFYPLLSLSPPAFNLSQHQGLFECIISLHQVAKVLQFQLQHRFPMNTQDWSPLGWTGWISLQSKGLSRVSTV